VFNAQALGAGFAGEMVRRGDEQFAADHLRDDAVRIGFADFLGGDMAAVAQHRDVVAQGEEFLNAVGDVDERDAAGFQLAHELEEIGGFGGGERAGGLVHHDDLGAGADGGGDLHELFAAGGERADDGVGIDVGADGGEHGLGARAEFAALDEARAARQVAEAEILGDAQVGAEREFLMHHGDAEFAGHQRSRRMDDLAVEADLAAVGGVHAGEDFAERALARAVLADERVAGAALHSEAHPVEREHAGEALGDAVELEEGHGKEGRASRPEEPRLIRRIRPTG
jgi:hypothetical protein